MNAPAVMAHVLRSSMVESVHRGSLVLLHPDGSTAYTAGDTGSPIYPRSSNKPLQAAAMLRAGARLSGHWLALAAASHAGEPFHVQAVQEILEAAGVGVDALGCPAFLPKDVGQRIAMVRDGDPTDRRLTMNCSGKHAGMLLACVSSGWPVTGYLDPRHPLQLAVNAEIEAATGERIAHVGTDGCNAPAAAFSLTGLARAFQRLAAAPLGTPLGQVAAAMRAHPEYVAGTHEPDTWLMSAVPGLLAKSGAEGVQAVALPDGRAFAYKIEDGSERAMGPVLAQVLRQCGIDSPVLERLDTVQQPQPGAVPTVIEAVAFT